VVTSIVWMTKLIRNNNVNTQFLSNPELVGLNDQHGHWITLSVSLGTLTSTGREGKMVLGHS
jgi:hypothetical protein